MLLAAGSLGLIVAGVALGWWMLNLPSLTRTACDGSPDTVTYVTQEGTYCMGRNPLFQPWLPVVTVFIATALLARAWSLDRRIGHAVHRGATGLAHASVLAALGLPFVVVTSGSCGPSIPVTGYQALSGFDMTSVAGYVGYRPDHIASNPAIALLVGIALVGVLASVWPGARADLARMATAALGIVAVLAAFAFTPRLEFHGLTFDNDVGIGAMLMIAALTLSLVVDVAVVLTRRLRARAARETAAPLPP